MNNGSKKPSGTAEVVQKQLQKNQSAIQKLKDELLVLAGKITDGEKRLEEAKEIMRRYQEVTGKILTLNSKIKQNVNISQKIRSNFEELIRQAEILEHDLARRGIRSVDDLSKLIKVTKDNRNMVTKYTDMVNNLEKQNEYYKTVALNKISEDSKNHGKDIKQIISELSKNYGVKISNFEQLNDEIHRTEHIIKSLVMRQSIARDRYNELRIIEECIKRYDKCKKELVDLKNKMSDGNIKNPAMIDKYNVAKDKLEKQLKRDVDFLKGNNVTGHKDFSEKDMINKEEIEKIESQLDLNNKKLGLLQEIKNDIRRRTQKKE